MMQKRSRGRSGQLNCSQVLDADTITETVELGYSIGAHTIGFTGCVHWLSPTCRALKLSG
jgi:hypothetical protein